LATLNFILVAHVVAVGVIQASARTIEVGCSPEVDWVITVGSIRGCCVVVTGFSFLTTYNFVLITHTVAVSVVVAGSVAIKVAHWVEIGSVNTCAVVRIRVVSCVTSSGVRTTGGLILVTHTVGVGVVQAVSVTIDVAHTMKVYWVET
jgi:hypothetical protein